MISGKKREGEWDERVLGGEGFLLPLRIRIK
jgi:hypothetical protein